MTLRSELAPLSAMCLCAAGLALSSGCEQIADLSGRRAPQGRVAALVDDDPIYDVQVALEAQAQGLIGPDQILLPDSPDYAAIVDQLIDQHLLAREAERRLLHTDAQSRHRLAMARQRILGNLLLETLTAQNVGEDTVAGTYDAQRELMQLGSEAHVRHIVLKSRRRADQILDELSTGADFAILAANDSIDARTRLEGGDLGYVNIETAPAAMRPLLRDTPIGRAGGPVQTELGWHVIRIEDRRQETPPSLEDLRPQIMQFLILAEVDRELRRLRASAQISVTVAKQGITDPFDLADEENGPAQSDQTASEPER